MTGIAKKQSMEKKEDWTIKPKKNPKFDKSVLDALFGKKYNITDIMAKYKFRAKG